ncbi:MAG: NAD(+) diphosphatase [Polyangiaceae bacterium]
MSGGVWFVIHPKGLVVRRKGEAFALLTDADLVTLGLDAELGHAIDWREKSGARAIPFAAENVEPPFEVLGLRTLARAFDFETFMNAGRPTHIVDWATTNRFCGRCGTATIRTENERCMACPSCKLTAYPRISPAIIVLVRRGNQALLARNARFPGVFFSTLAGFAEIGESLEETLAREVREEVGIGVKNIRYFGSQPWPFPNSLMIGYTCEWADGEIAVDGEEIAEAQWFSASELPAIPPRISIARKLIDAWVAEVAG